MGAKTLEGQESYCVRAFAEAFEIVPYTLAENAGLNAMNIVTQLRNNHVSGNIYDGINVRRGAITHARGERVAAPACGHERCDARYRVCASHPQDRRHRANSVS